MKYSFIIVFLTLFTLPLLHGQELKLGADKSDIYLPMLEGKKVALLVNHTSRVGEQHLLDFLLDQGLDVKKVFSPEHGFRGDADAGAEIQSGRDPKSGLEVISLYGQKKKPAAADLKGLDWVIFDIQDVGTRFYTYISTMHYVMEACAENKIQFMVLDRPNPNGHFIDGPMRKAGFESFVGVHPIPVVHGLTVGELAHMINGEKWLKNGIQCSLTVIEMEHYRHSQPYSLPVKPSPNLPNDQAIRWYPTLCFFEGTDLSVGRGTPYPFQVLGSPFPSGGEFTFRPTSMPGASSPKHEGKTLYGKDFRSKQAPAALDLELIIDMYQLYPQKNSFFLPFFNKLAGTDELMKQIKAGKSAAEIRSAWETELQTYRKLREAYLLYKD